MKFDRDMLASNTINLKIVMIGKICEKQRRATHWHGAAFKPSHIVFQRVSLAHRILVGMTSDMPRRMVYLRMCVAVELDLI